jgi:enamine deaminase RidA (YjgF/YER057c/UK114 family)
MAAQLELTLDNLEAIVTAADMTLANIVRLNVYTTDVGEAIGYFPRINDRFVAPVDATSGLRASWRSGHKFRDQRTRRISPSPALVLLLDT